MEIKKELGHHNLYLLSDQNEATIHRYDDHYRVQRLVFSVLDRLLLLVPGLAQSDNAVVLFPRRLLLANGGPFRRCDYHHGLITRPPSSFSGN